MRAGGENGGGRSPRNLGTLQRIRVGHDGKGATADWQLDVVQVRLDGETVFLVLADTSTWFRPPLGKQGLLIPMPTPINCRSLSRGSNNPLHSALLRSSHWAA